MPNIITHSNCNTSLQQFYNKDAILSYKENEEVNEHKNQTNVYVTFGTYQTKYPTKKFKDYLIAYFNERGKIWLLDAILGKGLGNISRIMNDLSIFHPEVTNNDFVKQYRDVVDIMEKKKGKLSDVSFALSNLNSEEFNSLKTLIGAYFPKIETIDIYGTDYKDILFTNEEVFEIMKKLGETDVVAAKNLSGKLVPINFQRWFYASIDLVVELFLTSEGKICDEYLNTLVTGGEFENLQKVKAALYGSPEDSQKIADVATQVVASIGMAIVQIIVTHDSVKNGNFSYLERAYGMPVDQIRLKTLLERLTYQGLQEYKLNDRYLSRIIWLKQQKAFLHQLEHLVKNAGGEDLSSLHEKLNSGLKKLLIATPLCHSSEYDTCYRFFYQKIEQFRKQLADNHPELADELNQYVFLRDKCFRGIYGNEKERPKVLHKFSKELSHLYDHIAKKIEFNNPQYAGNINDEAGDTIQERSFFEAYTIEELTIEHMLDLTFWHCEVNEKKKEFIEENKALIAAIASAIKAKQDKFSSFSRAEVTFWALYLAVLFFPQKPKLLKSDTKTASSTALNAQATKIESNNNNQIDQLRNFREKRLKSNNLIDDVTLSIDLFFDGKQRKDPKTIQEISQTLCLGYIIKETKDLVDRVIKECKNRGYGFKELSREITFRNRLQQALQNCGFITVQVSILSKKDKIQVFFKVGYPTELNFAIDTLITGLLTTQVLDDFNQLELDRIINKVLQFLANTRDQAKKSGLVRKDIFTEGDNYFNKGALFEIKLIDVAAELNGQMKARFFKPSIQAKNASLDQHALVDNPAQEGYKQQCR